MTAALFALLLLPALNDDADPRTLVRWASSRCEPAVSGSCGREPHGYCDASVGRCVCSPGRFGPRCEQMHYPACRLHPDGEMACDTFVGLMSCACRLSCEQRYGSMARFNTPLCWDESVSDEELSRRSLQADGGRSPATLRTHTLPTLPDASGRASLSAGALTALSLVNTSDFPAASASIVFRTDQWPLRGRCARKNIAPAKLAACTSRTAVGHNKATRQRGEGGAPPLSPRTPPVAAPQARNMLGGDPVPNWRCPGSCSHRGTCLVPAA